MATRSSRSRSRPRGSDGGQGGRDARGPPHTRRTTTRRPVDRGPLARRATQRLDRPKAGGTPAVHRTRVQRLEEPWTAGLWPAVRPRTRSTQGGRDARGPPHTRRTTTRRTSGPRASARRATKDSIDPRRAGRPRSTAHATHDDSQNQWTAGLWPAVRPTDSIDPRRAGRPRSTAHETHDDSQTSGPRAAGPPCDQGLDRPKAGKTPAVHRTRDARRLADQWTAGLWPAVRSTTRTTQGGRDARGPPHTRRTRSTSHHHRGPTSHRG